MQQQTGTHRSLFAAIVDTIGSADPEARLRKLETLLGFVGFFALVMVVRSAAATLQGAPSAGDAMLAALLVGITYLLARRWQALGRRVADTARSRRGAR